MSQAVGTLHKLTVDQHTNKETEVEYCSIGNTTTELFIKLLQCSQFNRFRDIIMSLQNGASMPPVVRMIQIKHEQKPSGNGKTDKSVPKGSKRSNMGF